MFMQFHIVAHAENLQLLKPHPALAMVNHFLLSSMQPALD
jgi:hypothetical protein